MITRFANRRSELILYDPSCAGVFVNSKMDDSRKLRNQDRLSELPDSLIIAILSFLEMSDAVRTSVLSKRWKDLWTTVPSLNFWCPRDYDLDAYRSFVNYALLRWKGSKILRFELPFHGDILARPRDLDSWLLFAIGKQVEELCLWSGITHVVDWHYCPPQRLYTSSSIRKLTLSHIKLSIPENVQLGQLTSLTICGSESLSGRGMTRLLSGAPMLEELALLCMDIREDFNIRSNSLKKLQIGRSQSGVIDLHSVLRIWAPNLSTLEIKAGVHGYASCFHVDVPSPSLTTAILNIYQITNQDSSLWGTFHQVVRSIRHAQSVTLSDWCTEVLLHWKRKGMSVEFSNAKHLQLCLVDEAVDERLFAVLETFPKLLTLMLVIHITRPQKDDDSFSAFEKKIDIPLPHLKTCEIRCFKTNPSILRLVKAVLENGEMLEKMSLRVHDEGRAFGWATLQKVLSMRRASPKARVIYTK